MGKAMWFNTLVNKRNKQISITLPKRKLNFLDEDKVPKKIKMKIEDLKW